MRLRVALGVLAALTLLSGRVRAQTSCTATGIPGSCTTLRTLSLTIRPTVQITLSPTSLDLGNPTGSDFNQGYTQATATQVVTVQSNTTWTLTIRTSQTTWTNVGGRANKNRGDLEWATDPGGPWTAMPGNGNAAALTIATGSATGGTAVTIYYRVLWSWTLDTAGSYTLPVVLRITAP